MVTINQLCEALRLDRERLERENPEEAARLRASEEQARRRDRERMDHIVRELAEDRDGPCIELVGDRLLSARDEMERRSIVEYYARGLDLDPPFVVVDLTAGLLADLQRQAREQEHVSHLPMPPQRPCDLRARAAELEAMAAELRARADEQEGR